MGAEPLADSGAESDSTASERETDFDFGSDDCGSNASADTEPISSQLFMSECDLWTLMQDQKMSFLDEISVEHFLQNRVLLRRTIPKEFVRPWNKLLLSFMSLMTADSKVAGHSLQSSSSERLFKLFWMLPRLMWHTPSD